MESKLNFFQKMFGHNKPSQPSDKSIPGKENNGIENTLTYKSNYITLPKRVEMLKGSYALTGKALKKYKRLKKGKANTLVLDVKSAQKQGIQRRISQLSTSHSKTVKQLKEVEQIRQIIEETKEEFTFLKKNQKIGQDTSKLAKRLVEKIQDRIGYRTIKEVGESNSEKDKYSNQLIESIKENTLRSSIDDYKLKNGDNKSKDENKFNEEDVKSLISIIKTIREDSKINKPEFSKSKEKEPVGKEENLKIRTLKLNITDALAEKIEINSGKLITKTFGNIRKSFQINTKYISKNSQVKCEKEAKPVEKAINDKKKSPFDSDVKGYEQLQRLLNYNSPIDNPSVKDFKSLQIAWESIWSEASSQDGPTFFDEIPNIPEEIMNMLPMISDNEWAKYVIWSHQIGSTWKVMLNNAYLYRIYEIFILLLSDKVLNQITKLEEEVRQIEINSGRSGLLREVERIYVLGHSGNNDWTTQKRNDYTINKNQILERAKELIQRSGEEINDNETIHYLESRGYSFPIYAPGHVNYGLMTTYRQTWTPLQWQVGELVKTIPLTAGETRKYKKKVRQLKKQSRKEVESNSSLSSLHDQFQRDAKEEIIDRAFNITSFEANANVGDGTNNANAAFRNSSENESKDTKNNIRGATLKATEEFKQEHKIEINEEESYETDFTDEGTIKNPNDEITVTYLFYELERAYEIKEHLHSIESVILIPNVVPAKQQITWEWIKKNHWILKRVVLDIDFIKPIEWAMLGEDEINHTQNELEKKLVALMKLVSKIESKLENLGDDTTKAQAAADLASDTITSLLKSQHEETLLDLGIELLYGDKEAQEIEDQEYLKETALDKLNKIQERIVREEGKLGQARNTLDRATDNYNRAYAEAKRKINKVENFITHIQDNILYYMQKIWSYEYSEQRFMRLFPQEVPFIEYPEDDKDIYIRQVRPTSLSDIIKEGSTVEVILPEPGLPVNKKLHEVADLDNLLGFKGNYMIFPLKIQSYMTAYMAQSYLSGVLKSFEDKEPQSLPDFNNLITEAVGFEYESPSNQAFNLQDPDRYSESVRDLEFETSEAYKNNKESSNGDIKKREQLEDYLKRMQCHNTSEPETIVVPTGSLYIEALPGKKSILEPFKEKHRKLDVKDKKLDLKLKKLETERREKLLEEPNLMDPDIDKRIEIFSNGVPVNNNINP
ncbi:hypothetical protein [Aquimarina sp. 2304DJ70-9]|uniref:hypothetical protein n=1 Tax=Aquimarina penaris TaxID=3231044 RepID=UPI003462339D